MTIVQRIARLQSKLHNMSPKPAKRLQQSLATLEFNFLVKALPVKDRNLWAMNVHPLLHISCPRL